MVEVGALLQGVGLMVIGVALITLVFMETKR